MAETLNGQPLTDEQRTQLANALLKACRDFRPNPTNADVAGVLLHLVAEMQVRGFRGERDALDQAVGRMCEHLRRTTLELYDHPEGT